MTAALPFPRPSDIDLIVSDVDGTLLTSEHKIAPLTQASIRALRSTSVPFVICSGKQYNSCKWMRAADALDLRDDDPSLHCHGCLHHGAGGELVSSVGLDPAAIDAVVQGLPNHALFLFTPDAVFLVQDCGRQDWLNIARRYDHNVHDARESREREALLARIRSGDLAIVKVTIGTTPEETADTLASITALHDAFDAPPWKCTRAISFILELVPPGVNKAVAVTALCRSLGIPLSRVLAFGDGDNDAEMLAAVGHGVAMGNAMPLAAAAARYRTSTNNEGGVGAFLQRVYGFSPVEKL